MRKKTCDQCHLLKEDAVVRDLERGVVMCLCDDCYKEFDDGEDWAFSAPGQPSKLQ